MKSEHRHQLETNELADWIVRMAEQVRSRWHYIVGSLAILIAIYAGVQYFSGASARQLKDAWIDFFGANNPGQFEAVADRHAGLVVSYYARLRAADLRFDEAKRELLNDYSGASLKLDKVVQTYDKLADDGQAPPAVRRHAALGKALALETQGNLATAKTAYERVANNVEFAGTAEALHAQERLKKIGEPLAKRFYDQLARFEPPARGLGGSANPLEGLPPLPPRASESGATEPPIVNPPIPIMPDLERVTVPPPPKKAAKTGDTQPSKPADKPGATSSSTDAKTPPTKPEKTGEGKASKPADKPGATSSSNDGKAPAAKPEKVGDAKAPVSKK